MAHTERESFVAVDTQIASSLTEYVTTGASDVIAIDKLIIYNTNTTIEVVKVYIDGSGNSPAAANQYIVVSVSPGAHLDLAEATNLTLGNTQGLFMITTTAVKVNLHISGRRIVG